MATPACRWRVVRGFADLLALHERRPERYPHLLESVVHGTPQSRFDILFAFPGETITSDATGNVWRSGHLANHRFLDALRLAWRESALPVAVDAPIPFHGGWFVYLGYELVREIEPATRGIPAGHHGPVALAQRFRAAIIRDHLERQIYVTAETSDEDCLAEMIQDIEQAGGAVDGQPMPVLETVAVEDPAVHQTRISRALDYIRAGDLYQANLSRHWRADFESPPSAATVYRQLRAANPSPFAALATIAPEWSIASSSPERLVEVRTNRIHTRPIAGTYPRADEPDRDREQPGKLVRNPKERAEHIMLVDLERNDLGKLCRPGSVKVDELLVVESYRHVHHLVSRVSGELRDGIEPTDVLASVFPGGTITGCPKIRTMQVIAELEQSARGPYTGSVGYINRDGSLDFNILIRTLVIRGRSIEWRSGGGIVADSDPEMEIRETDAKARGMLRALGMDGGSG